MNKPESTNSLSSEILAFSSEGQPVFGEKITQIVERALDENRPILFATIMCRVSKLTGHANRRFWTPDVIWAKARNDQPVEITLEAAKQDGISLVNPKLGLIFAETPQLIKRVSSLGLPWRFLMIVADDPSLEVRKSLSKQFKTFEKASRAFETMCHLHREAIIRVFLTGLENQGMNSRVLLSDKQVTVTSFERINKIDFPGIEAHSFIDMCASIARKLQTRDLGNLPEDILAEFKEASKFWQKREPQKSKKEIERMILEELIPSKVLAGKFLGEKVKEEKMAGAIIFSAIRPQPLDKTQSLLLPSSIPVLFPFQNVEGNSLLAKIQPAGTLVPPEASWFSVASSFTLDLTRWMHEELEKTHPNEREMAEVFMPTIFGRKRIHD